MKWNLKVIKIKRIIESRSLFFLLKEEEKHFLIASISPERYYFELQLVSKIKTRIIFEKCLLYYNIQYYIFHIVYNYS